MEKEQSKEKNNTGKEEQVVKSKNVSEKEQDLPKKDKHETEKKEKEERVKDKNLSEKEQELPKKVKQKVETEKEKKGKQKGKQKEKAVSEKEEEEILTKVAQKSENEKKQDVIKEKDKIDSEETAKKQTKKEKEPETEAFQPVAAAAPVPSTQAPSAAPPKDEWYYKSPDGQLQGPYDPEDMKQWYEEGYFEPTLPIARNIDPDAVNDDEFITLEAYGDDIPFCQVESNELPPFELNDEKKTQLNPAPEADPIVIKVFPAPENKVDHWYYKDSAGKIIGPHSADEMAYWVQDKKIDEKVLVGRNINLKDSTSHKFYSLDTWLKTNNGQSPFLDEEVHTPVVFSTSQDDKEEEEEVEDAEEEADEEEADEEDSSESSDQWYYKDVEGNIQGPFPGQQMHYWHQHSFFEPTLLIAKNIDPKNAKDSDFAPLETHFQTFKSTQPTDKENGSNDTSKGSKGDSKQDLWYYRDSEEIWQGPLKRKDLKFWFAKGEIKKEFLVACNIDPIAVKKSDTFMTYEAFAKQEGKTDDTEVQSPSKEKIEKWYYKDRKGAIQGPFSTKDMVAWYKQKHFDKYLLVARALKDPNVLPTNFISLDRLINDGNSFLGPKESQSAKVKGKKAPTDSDEENNQEGSEEDDEEEESTKSSSQSSSSSSQTSSSKKDKEEEQEEQEEQEDQEQKSPASTSPKAASVTTSSKTLKSKKSDDENENEEQEVEAEEADEEGDNADEDDDEPTEV